MELFDVATQVLSWLLGEEDATALLGDVREDGIRRSKSAGGPGSQRSYRDEVYASLAAALRLRAVEWVRCAPWATVFGSYVLVGGVQFASTVAFSYVWPPAAQTTNPLSLLGQFPAIALMAYVAGAFNRAAPFLLGALMLFAAVLLITFSKEEISTEYRLAVLTVGPLAALMGGTLHCTVGRKP
jgi:hypothetical protein